MRVFLPLLTAVFVISSAACTKTETTGAGPQRSMHPGILRIAIPQDVKTLNPILASSTVDNFAQRLLFEPLLSADPQGNPVPMLARQVPTPENGGVSADGLTVTYRLRKNLRWSDGVPLTSRDVEFSWRAIVNPNNNAVSKHGYDDIAAVETPDEWTAIVRLKRPLASFVNTFFAESDQPYSIVPAHVLARYASINRVDFNSNPTVSDGPFLFERWLHGDSITLKRNERFFLGRPRLQRVEIRVVPDENTGITLLRTHSIDYMYQPSIATYPALRTIPGVHIVWVNMNAYEGMQVNMRRGGLRDARVRQAVALSIDKVRLVRTLTFGRERAASADLPDWMWAADPNLHAPARDIGRARALLRAAGVLPLSLVLVTDTATVTHRRAALEIQSMLRDAGVNVEVKYYPADFLYAPAGMGGILHEGRFDLSIIPWYAGIDPDNSSQLSCENMPPNGYNDARYCNPEMQALQHEALATTDRARRRAAYHQIERLVLRDNPLIVFWWLRQQEAISDDFKGFDPNLVSEAWNAWQWSI